MAASTPYRRTGWRVISATRSGSMQDSSMPTPSRTRAVLRQRAAGLAHEPDRRVRHRLAAHGPQEGAVTGVGGAGRSRPKPRRSVGVFAHREPGARPTVGTWSSRQETHPGAGAAASRPEFRGGRRDHARGPAAARDPLRGDAGTAADRAVRRRAVGRRHRRRRRRRHRPDHPAARPRGQRRVGRRPSAASPTPAPRSTLELITDPMLAAVGWTWLTEALDAHGAAYHRRLRHGDPRGDRELRRDGRRGRRRPARDPRLVDAASPPDGAPTGAARRRARTSRRGASCSARRSGCHRCPTAWP